MTRASGRDNLGPLRRLALVALAAGIACSSAMSAAVSAVFPDRAVKLVVPTAAGGAVDGVARVVGQALSRRWGQPVVIENKPGAGGAIGAAQVARSAPDGYTLAFISTGYTALSAMQPNLPFDPARDLAPVAQIGAVPYVLLVRSDSPYRSVAQMLAAGREQPGRLAFASGGNGTLTHLLAEWFAAEAELEILHVPYAGAGPALQALIGGQVAAYFDPISTSTKLIESQRVRPLATTGAQRSRLLPDVPTLAERGMPVRGSVWFGLLAPARTMPDRIEQLQDDVTTVLADPEVRGQLTRSGIDVQAIGSAEFGRFLSTETSTWGGLVRRKGIRSE